MRKLYTLILYLIAPVVLARLYVRSLRAPAYRHRIGERFGRIEPVAGGGAIWIHAVSVGETQAALPLIRALRERVPQRPIVVTTTTPTGSDRVRESLGSDVTHYYLPYDLPGALRRFMNAVRPLLLVIMETEIWPNLFHACAARHVALVLANARLSPASVRGYARFRPLVARTLSRATLICAQSDVDAERFRALGARADRVCALGSIKFDLRIPPAAISEGAAVRRLLGNDRHVWIAASTHEGEEAEVLKAYERVRERVADCLLILVPRHPERFDSVAELCASHGWRTVRRSGGASPVGCDIYLGDSMGELMMLFAVSDVAFVGGSLVPIGGHNILEPAALGRPVQFGPYTFSAEEAADRLLQAGGGIRIRDARELAESTVELLLDPERRAQMGSAAHQTVQANRGALQRLLNALDDFL